MKAATDQTEILLLDLERRARVLQDCSEKLETQLKVMLVRESSGHFSHELVARIANALAICLSSRGDSAQAGQYALMAANLERRQGSARQPVESAPARLEVDKPEANSSVTRAPAAGTGTGQHLLGHSRTRPRSFVSLWGAWLALNRRTAKRLGR